MRHDNAGLTQLIENRFQETRRQVLYTGNFLDGYGLGRIAQSQLENRPHRIVAFL